MGFHYMNIMSRYRLNCFFFFSSKQKGVFYFRRWVKNIKMKGINAKLCFFFWTGMMNKGSQLIKPMEQNTC